MIVMGACSASHIATVLFPAAVGPQMTSSSSPAESTLNLVPGELNYRGAPVHVVRGQRRVAKGDEQRAHLVGRQRLAGLDRRLAGNGRGESFVSSVRPRLAI